MVMKSTYGYKARKKINKLKTEAIWFIARFLKGTKLRNKDQ